MIVSVLEHVVDAARPARRGAPRCWPPAASRLVNVPSWRGKRYLELSAFRLGLEPGSRDGRPQDVLRRARSLAAAGAAGFRPSRIRCFPHKLGLNTFAVCRAVDEPDAGARWSAGCASPDWVDLQWSLLDASLRAVAPRARGRLLDVGCGDKPYEAWFRPYVTAYIGIEHAATFARRRRAGAGRAPTSIYGGGGCRFATAASTPCSPCRSSSTRRDPRGADRRDEPRARARRPADPDARRSSSACTRSRTTTSATARTACARCATTRAWRSSRRCPGEPVDGDRPQAEQLPRVPRGARRPAGAGDGEAGARGAAARAAPLVDAAAGGPSIVSIAVGARVMDRLFPRRMSRSAITILAQRRRGAGS